MRDFNDIYSVVKDLPIIDWHNHLDMNMLADDKPLGSLYEVWVKADPYKHRAMRICGEPECLITGDAPESEKWAAWMRTLPKLIGNPLFVWAKMEIEWLNRFNAEKQGCTECGWWRNLENISLSGWTPSKMLKAFNVECICPCVGASELNGLKVSGRADCPQPAAADSRSFGRAACPQPAAADSRSFGRADCPQPAASDSQSLGRAACPQAAAARWGQRALPLSIIPSLRMNAGDEITVEDLERFAATGCRVVDISVDDASQLSTHYAQLSTVASFAAAHGWTMLLHLGALRSTSERLRAAAGPAGGFAGMRAPIDPTAVASFLNRLEHGRADCPQPAATDSRSFGRADCPQAAATDSRSFGRAACPQAAATDSR